jgi:hypothetical protein
MSAFESAIDDSFEPIPQPPPDEEYTDDSFFDAYQGPRDGHWEVASSVGSFIDDRCPTEYGYHHKSYGAGRKSLVDEGLARRLMQATIENKRNAAIAAARTVPPLVQSSERIKNSPAPSEVKKPKPFFVPALHNRPHDPMVPDIPETTNSAAFFPVAGSIRSHHKPSSTAKVSASAGRPTPPPAVTRASAASDKLDSSPSTTRTIKILGKNGEVAFVNLPSLPKTYSQAPSSVRYVATDKPAERSGNTSRLARPAHSSHSNFGSDKSKKHVIPAIHTSVAEEQTQEQDDHWASRSLGSGPKQTHQPPSVIMSGALPIPSLWASPVPQSVAASCKDSGVVMGGMSAVVSKAGSDRITSIRPGSAISQGVFGVAQKIANMPANSHGKSNSVPADLSPQLFNEVGMGVTTGFPAPKMLSERSNRTADYPNLGSAKASQRSAWNDAQSAKSVHDRSKQDEARSNYKPPSIHSTSRSVYPDFPGFGSERASLRSRGDDAPFAKSDYERGKEGTVRSNYKPPTVHSASSASSISHAFGGFQHVQQADTQSARLEDRQSSTHLRQAQSEATNGTRYAASSSKVGAAHSITRLSRPEVSMNTTALISPLSDGTSPNCPSHSPVSPLALSPYVLLAGKQPTRFAGDGWISPHPLSVATTDIGAGPQSAVHIDADGTGHGGTLTYREWRAQRDAAKSFSGSFAGSRVPSAVELDIAPPAVYNYPPPASFVGCYEQQTRQHHQLRPQVDQHIGQDEVDQGWAHQHHASERTALIEDHQQSLVGQNSIQSHALSSEIKRNALAYDGSVHHGSTHRTPSVLAQDAGWNLPPQHDGHDGSAPGSGHTSASGYNVGLTPAELSSYHTQLRNTVSRHSSRLSYAEQEQKLPQPNYQVWNSGQSHASRRTASHRSARSRHSAHAFPPNLSYPREKTQIEMPWDHAQSHVSSSSSSSRSSHTRSQQQFAAIQREAQRESHRESQINALARGTGSSIHQPLASNHVSSRVSVMSQQRGDMPHSQLTYGTEEWQDLENAEDGHGRFRSRQDWRLW